MTLELVNYEQKTLDAVKHFWNSRQTAQRTQAASGKGDIGERGSVTSGKNMDGFLALIEDLVVQNGLANAEICRNRSMLTLPGYFRPTKLWDVLVLYQGNLIAAIELKSQVGPSFGNNFNNRVEEAIGTAHDFWTAYREGAIGSQPRPSLAWLVLVEDAPKSQKSVNAHTPHFPIFPEFNGASYLQRYNLFCQKLVKEQLYSTATLLTSPRSGAKGGKYAELSEMTSIKTFVTAFAGHVAAESARLQ